MSDANIAADHLGEGYDMVARALSGREKENDKDRGRERRKTSGEDL